jgi:putative peptide zinc metalloprotease protein
MLFYGVPALFCDVTDAWRLDRRQRVGVALAGIRLNLFVAAISSLLVSTMHAGSGRQALSYIGFVNLLIAAINLCPLVKFDGYIAVVGWRDEPHLRARCMDEAQTWVARSVSGGSGARTSPGRVAFGVACAVAGPALVLRAFLSYESLAFASLGRVAGGVALGAETLGAIFVARRLRVIVKRARRGPVRAVRSVIIVAGVLAVAVTLLWGTSLSRSVSTVYVADAGRAAVVTTGKAPIRFGAPVRLYTAGVLRRPIGNAVVCGGTAPRAIPSEAGLAITLRVRVSMQPTVLACLQSGRLEGSGIARLPRGRTTLGGWIRWTLWDKPMRQLLSA